MSNVPWFTESKTSMVSLTPKVRKQKRKILRLSKYSWNRISKTYIRLSYRAPDPVFSQNRILILSRGPCSFFLTKTESSSLTSTLLNTHCTLRYSSQLFSSTKLLKAWRRCHVTLTLDVSNSSSRTGRSSPRCPCQVSLSQIM